MDITIPARLVVVLEASYVSKKSGKQIDYVEVQTLVTGVGIIKWKFKSLSPKFDKESALSLQGKDVSLIVSISTNRYDQDAPLLVLQSIVK